MLGRICGDPYQFEWLCLLTINVGLLLLLEAIRRKIELDVHTGDEVYLGHIKRYRPIIVIKWVTTTLVDFTVVLIDCCVHVIPYYNRCRVQGLYVI